MIHPMIAGKDVVLSYGNTVAISSSTFEVPSSLITTIIGPNGSGKSTLLNAIAGLSELTAGTITIDGGRSKAPVSYVLQTTKVNEHLPITVGEVVAMGRYSTLGPYRRPRTRDRKAVAEAIERTSIGHLMHRHLNDLSGGERQRVLVAQGLAQDHRILLLDEPLTGIDLPTAQAIDTLIHEETTRGCTVVMTTHDLSEAQIADHVLLLAGRVVASGPPGEALTRANLVEAYGQSLLHIDDASRLFLDDPAHPHFPGRHSHRERVIHTEAVPGEVDQSE